MQWRRRVLGLVMIAVALLIVGVVALDVVGDDDGAPLVGLGALPSCRTGPAAESEPDWDALPGWAGDALDTAAPADATCRELSYAEAASGDLSSFHLRLEGAAWEIGIDAEAIDGTVEDYTAFLPFELTPDERGDVFRAGGNGAWYAFPSRDGRTWAISVTGDPPAAHATAARLSASWGVSNR